MKMREKRNERNANKKHVNREKETENKMK